MITMATTKITIAMVVTIAMTTTSTPFPLACSPLSAMTLLAGFMMALSALIGRRIGLVGSDMSMMTTWAVSPTWHRGCDGG